MTELIGSRRIEAVPRLRIKWIRFRDTIEWSRPSHHISVGMRDSGKSALGEVIACHYPQIIDIFGSKDNEGLAWCRSGIDDILLIVGDNCDLEAPWDVVRISDLTYNKMKNYECVITVPSFYTTDNNLFRALQHVTQNLYKRLEWKYPSFIIIREAANFLYSRISKGDTNKDAKAEFIRFQREMRHFGYTIFLDTIRWTAVDKEMRDLADYVYFKDLGYMGLGKDVGFIYNYIKPFSLAGLSPKKFVVLTRRAAIGVGTADYPSFHKEEGENLLTQFDLKPEFGEEIQYSAPQKVGDFEHAEFIKLYVEDNHTIGEIAFKKHRSKSTIQGHFNRHNNAIIRKNYCPICRRINSGFETTFAKRG